MSDQCGQCLRRNDYRRCIETECSHHENWINRTRIARIKALEEALQIIADLPGDRVDEGANYASNILGILPPRV